MLLHIASLTNTSLEKNLLSNLHTVVGETSALVNMQSHWSADGLIISASIAYKEVFFQASEQYTNISVF
jgi:hypothetical protein